MYKVGDEEFDALVEAAMEGLPAKFASAIDNVAFAVADEPDEEELEIGAEYGTCEEESGELLGLYDARPSPSAASITATGPLTCPMSSPCTRGRTSAAATAPRSSPKRCARR